MREREVEEKREGEGKKRRRKKKEKGDKKTLVDIQHCIIKTLKLRSITNFV